MPEKVEIFPLVDADGKVTGKATRAECHCGIKLLHPVVHLHCFDAQGRLYLQKRAARKDTYPGLWDTSVGGHVDYGEEVGAALLREANEELALHDIYPIFLFRYLYESEVERELVYVYCVTLLSPPHPNKDEVSEGRFWKVEEALTSLGKGIFTPNFEGEIHRMLQATGKLSTREKLQHLHGCTIKLH
ncbi:MAG: NUDIX domain-containing protein [Prevotellaceae bacterium]|jgi:isopentenyl-diphosphate delta-isomerase type 1|nr:NUDIX domain-containing protein [Prevotellaceae bacterium]